jgi:hypothetical protein
MVSQTVLVKDKHRGLKKGLKIFSLVLILGIIIFAIYYTFIGMFFDNSNSPQVILENPLKNIIFKHTDENNVVNLSAVISEGVMEFNIDYINYIILSLGTEVLHKSPLNLENPKIEIILDNDVWSSELIKGVPNTENKGIDDEDIRISLSKEEAVSIILSEDPRAFVSESVVFSRTIIEMIAGKAELYSKGYLDLYEKLTGEELI